VVELDIDRLRQTVEEDLDVRPGRCGLAGGNFDIGTEDATEPGIVWAFLRPVDMSEFRVDRQTNAPSRLIPGIGFTVPASMSVSSREPSRLQRMTRIPSRSHQ